MKKYYYFANNRVDFQILFIIHTQDTWNFASDCIWRLLYSDYRLADYFGEGKLSSINVPELRGTRRFTYLAGKHRDDFRGGFRFGIPRSIIVTATYSSRSKVDYFAMKIYRGALSDDGFRVASDRRDRRSAATHDRCAWCSRGMFSRMKRENVKSVGARYLAKGTLE